MCGGTCGVLDRLWLPDPTPQRWTNVSIRWRGDTVDVAYDAAPEAEGVAAFSPAGTEAKLALSTSRQGHAAPEIVLDDVRLSVFYEP